MQVTLGEAEAEGLGFRVAGLGLFGLTIDLWGFANQSRFNSPPNSRFLTSASLQQTPIGGRGRGGGGVAGVGLGIRVWGPF